jgi:uncharacterized protein YecE (DUF72 family)
MAGRIVVGTASWADPEFIRDWYPQGIPAKGRLPWYAQHFDMVELNSSFYGIPTDHQIEEWRRVTPDNFVFNVKLHKALSRHSAALNSLPKELQQEGSEHNQKVILTPELEQEIAERFVAAVEPLETANKLGVLLLQLSPVFSPRKNRIEELDLLLRALMPHRVAVEFRNRNWTENETFNRVRQFLQQHDAAFACVDAPRANHFMIMPSIDAVTAPFAYLRLHGRNARGYISGKSVPERFDYKYSDDELGEVAQRAQKLAAQADEVHVVFNNNRSNYAPINALALRKILN